MQYRPAAPGRGAGACFVPVFYWGAFPPKNPFFTKKNGLVFKKVKGGKSVSVRPSLARPPMPWLGPARCPLGALDLLPPARSPWAGATAGLSLCLVVCLPAVGNGVSSPRRTRGRATWCEPAVPSLCLRGLQAGKDRSAVEPRGRCRARPGEGQRGRQGEECDLRRLALSGTSRREPRSRVLQTCPLRLASCPGFFPGTWRTAVSVLGSRYLTSATLMGAAFPTPVPPRRGAGAVSRPWREPTVHNGDPWQDLSSRHDAPGLQSPPRPVPGQWLQMVSGGGRSRAETGRHGGTLSGTSHPRRAELIVSSARITECPRPVLLGDPWGRAQHSSPIPQELA